MGISAIETMGTTPVEARAFDFVEKVGAATTIDEVYALLASELRNFGFTDFLVTDMPPPSLQLETHLILNGWSEPWFERYVEQGFYRHDPMAKHTRETSLPFFWHEVALGSEHTPEARQVMDEASEFGLKQGFSVPILGPDGDRSCVTMGGEKLDIPPRGREIIYVISLCAHQRARALRRDWAARPNRGDRTWDRKGAVLSAREREVLKWVALGKTDAEIGELLHISSATSFAHVRNSCRKLNAATRTQAVVRALYLGEISL
jgi:LuxR family quorum sensing-dependent transcriptional regulator